MAPNLMKKGRVTASDELAEEQAQILNDLCQNIALIHKNGERANKIVESMMTLSQRVPGKLKNTDLNRLLSEHAQLSSSMAKARGCFFDLDIRQDLDSRLKPFSLFPESLGRALINVFGNAIEAMQERRQREGKQYKPTLWVVSRVQDKHIEISIKDNGTGIPEDSQPRVFDYFFTTRSPDMGHVGLGLSISYDIIRQEHRGTIAINPRFNEFTEIVITLPIESEAK